MASPSGPAVDNGLLALAITIDGVPVPDAVQVRNIETSEEVSERPHAELAVIDEAAEGLPIANSDLFAPGKRLEIAAGWGGSTKSLFVGTIARLGIHLGAEATLLRVTAEGSAPVPEPARAPATPAAELIVGATIRELTAETVSAAGTHGTVSFQGNTEVRATSSLRLGGLGARFDGVVRLRAVRHQIGDGNWTTTATWSPDWAG